MNRLNINPTDHTPYMIQPRFHIVTYTFCTHTHIREGERTVKLITIRKRLISYDLRSRFFHSNLSKHLEEVTEKSNNFNQHNFPEQWLNITSEDP